MRHLNDPYEYESHVARLIGGRRTVASGAAFGDYDVLSPDWMVDCKLTRGHTYRLDSRHFEAIARRAAPERSPAIFVGFSSGLSLAVIDERDFASIMEALGDERWS